MGSAGNNWISDLNGLYNITQNTLICYPKDVIISTMRDFFSKDSLYHYSKDVWGFPNTPDLTGLPSDAGLYDDLTTRIFIGEVYRQDQMFFPAVLVRHTGTRNYPLSISHNRYTTEYKEMIFDDGYGNKRVIAAPDYLLQSGAYHSNFTIQVQAESIRQRDEILELIFMLLNDISWWNLNKVGISVKPNMSIGGTSEQDYRNRKLFIQDITIEIHSEWMRKFKINDFISQINICVELVNLASPNPISDPNFDIHEQIMLKN